MMPIRGLIISVLKVSLNGDICIFFCCIKLLHALIKYIYKKNPSVMKTEGDSKGINIAKIMLM